MPELTGKDESVVIVVRHLVTALAVDGDTTDIDMLRDGDRQGAQKPTDSPVR
jgi:hypothetical protein